MKEITLKDYKNFCSAQRDCDTCPLLGDNVSGIYEHCMGYISEYPEAADSIIQEWQTIEEKEKIEKRQSVYVIYDKYFSNTIYGVASSYETAERITATLGQEALANCLAVDPEDSGIHWDEMSEEQRKEFINTEIKEGFLIKEMKLDCYIQNEEVHAI